MRKRIGGILKVNKSTGYILSGIIVKEMSLNGEYLPIEEIKPNDWLGIASTLGHPKDSHGNHVLAKSIAGKPYINGSIIKAKLTAKGLYVVILLHKRLVVPQGSIVGCSVGFLRYLAVVNGKFASRRVKPDHVAILINEVGACSIDDGCGLAVHSKKGMRSMEDDTNDVVISDNSVDEVTIDMFNGLAARLESIENRLNSSDNMERGRLVDSLSVNTDQERAELMSLSINTLQVLAKQRTSYQADYSRGTSQLEDKPTKEKLIDFKF